MNIVDIVENIKNVSKIITKSWFCAVERDVLVLNFTKDKKEL